MLMLQKSDDSKNQNKEFKILTEDQKPMILKAYASNQGDDGEKPWALKPGQLILLNLSPSEK